MVRPHRRSEEPARYALVVVTLTIQSSPSAGSQVSTASGSRAFSHRLNGWKSLSTTGNSNLAMSDSYLALLGFGRLHLVDHRPRRNTEPDGCGPPVSHQLLMTTSRPEELMQSDRTTGHQEVGCDLFCQAVALPISLVVDAPSASRSVGLVQWYCRRARAAGEGAARWSSGRRYSDDRSELGDNSTVLRGDSWLYLLAAMPGPRSRSRPRRRMRLINNRPVGDQYADHGHLASRRAP